MKFKVNKSKCAGCGACLRACPHGAIKMGKDGKAFIDQDKCKKCGTCQRICPFDAIERILDKGEDKSFSAPSSYGSPPAGRRGLRRKRRGAGWGRDMGRKRRFRGGRG